MYFEQVQMMPRVHPENRPPCSRLYNSDIKGLLFDVSYFEKRINLEVFHALADGAGALHFLQQLVWDYLVLRYGYDRNLADGLPYDASHSQKEEDSFSRYYRPGIRSVEKTRRIPAYQERYPYLSESRIQVLTGHVCVSEGLELCKKLGVTLTAYLAAVLLLSYSKTMTWKDRKRPVVLAIPVNLRRFYDSETSRNFFSLIYVRYTFEEDDTDFLCILTSVKEQFQKQITAENVFHRVQKLVAIERNPFIRGIPLILKNPGLRIANSFVQKESTTTLSNLGTISMPDFCKTHISGFHAYIGTERTQLTICSYQDGLSLCFSTSFAGLEVQKHFFRKLADDGLSVSISASERPETEEK